MDPVTRKDTRISHSLKHHVAKWGLRVASFLAFLAFVASLGFGYWLITAPHSSRELYRCLIAWVLGFWVATGIRRSQAVGDPDGEDEWEDEEY